MRSFEDRVADLYAAANPYPSDLVERTTGSAPSPIDGSSRPMAEATHAFAPAARRSSRPRLASAAAVLVLLAGVVAAVVVWFVREGGEAASRPTGPAAVVDAFYARWSAGDIDGALRLADPGWPPGERAYLEAFDELGATFAISECVASPASPGVLSCRLAYGDPLAEEIGYRPRGCFITPRVDGRWVTYHSLSGDCQPETPVFLAEYAQRVDPEGLAAACADPGDGTLVEDGFAERYGFAVPLVYNRRCFGFLAGMMPGLAAEIASSG